MPQQPSGDLTTIRRRRGGTIPGGIEEMLGGRRAPMLLYTLSAEKDQEAGEADSRKLARVEERYEQWQTYKRLTPSAYRGTRVLVDRATETDRKEGSFAPPPSPAPVPTRRSPKKSLAFEDQEPARRTTKDTVPSSPKSSLKPTTPPKETTPIKQVTPPKETTPKKQATPPQETSTSMSESDVPPEGKRKKEKKKKKKKKKKDSTDETTPTTASDSEDSVKKKKPKKKKVKKVKEQKKKKKKEKKEKKKKDTKPKKTKSKGSLSKRLSGAQRKRRPTLWITADISRNVDHEKYVIYALRDLCFYLIFLTIISLVTFGVLDNAYNYYANVLWEVLTNTHFPTSLGIQRTYWEIATVNHIWDYMREVFMKAIYENNYDEKRSTEFVKPDSVLVLYDNILVGVPRMRQVRVTNDSCRVALIFANLFSSCYDYYYYHDEDRATFGIPKASPWIYQEDNNASSVFQGKISTYGGGGYSVNLDRDSRFTRNMLAQLEAHDWIRLGTRAVFIDFTTYTPNTNLFCVVKLVLELPPTGGVVPSAYFYTMKFLRYVDVWDYVILACELIFLGFVAYYTIEEVSEIMTLKMKYFQNAWNYLDFSILIMCYITIICGIVRFTVISLNMQSKVDNINMNTHAVFDDFVSVQMAFNTVVAILSFLTWIKLLKFAALNRSVALVLTIFSKVRLELIALTFILLTLVIGFGLFGHILFGTMVEQFNTVKNSMFTLIGLFVGGLYFYKECEAARPYIAPIYFILYIFFVIILFLNCFIALIVHGFYLAHEEFEDQRDRVYFIDVLKRFRYKFLRFIRKYEYAESLREKEIQARNKKSYDALVNVLRRHGFRGLDLALILKKYNIVPGNPISFEMMDEIYKDINARNQLYLEVEEHDKIMEQMDRINQKIEYLDQTLVDMMTKVDILVDKLIYKDIKSEERK